MQPSRPAQTTSDRAAFTSAADAVDRSIGAGQLRDIALGAGRELRSPLAALRVLLEGVRAGVTVTQGFAARALEEIDRAEAAAHDVLAWTMPRRIRSVGTTLGEIVESLRASLGPADRRRTHFVLEQEDTALATDAPLLVECFERSLRHLYRAARAADTEVMVHVHATADVATFSFIQTGGEAQASERDDDASLPSLADALLRSSVARLGGRTSIHEAEGHRCAVITLPVSTTRSHEEAAR
ncbi:hypothetical protein Poly30_05000 [Planctomycetes bacterium Poly30]|uniref:Signal transduction histidine kinase subgroup 3 dimerisation and phosphoacceptor domain-containing protein n=1 Tax=Saltatorellus ferox TaxID=2528018 RepID=A0A518ELN8_9BACT|nr:hypothetical protein Poly30_05000 [Planctomycetes bacterium Poly30]